MHSSAQADLLQKTEIMFKTPSDELGLSSEVPPGKYHYILSAVDEITDDGVSLTLTLIPVGGFDGVPYLRGGDMPYLEV